MAVSPQLLNILCSGPALPCLIMRLGLKCVCWLIVCACVCVCLCVCVCFAGMHSRHGFSCWSCLISLLVRVNWGCDASMRRCNSTKVIKRGDRCSKEPAYSCYCCGLHSRSRVWYAYTPPQRSVCVCVCICLLNVCVNHVYFWICVWWQHVFACARVCLKLWWVCISLVSVYMYTRTRINTLF